MAVKVNFAETEYFPLIKAKASISREGLPIAFVHPDGKEYSMEQVMEPLSQLRTVVFRALVAQNGETENRSAWKLIYMLPGDGQHPGNGESSSHTGWKIPAWVHRGLSNFSGK